MARRACQIEGTENKGKKGDEGEQSDLGDMKNDVCTNKKVKNMLAGSKMEVSNCQIK